MTPHRLLLASHGTPGGKAAEDAALDLSTPGGFLHHLYVVPDFWKGMMGDDWLNNVSTREVYAQYVESELHKEVLATIDRVEPRAKAAGLEYRAEVVLGKPAECLLKRLAADRFDLVVLGAPRPPGMTGIRSRLLTDAVLKALPVPLWIAPYPRDPG